MNSGWYSDFRFVLMIFNFSAVIFSFTVVIFHIWGFVDGGGGL